MYPHQEQVSLSDLLNLLVKYKKLYWVTFIVVLVVSAIVILRTSLQQYKYIQTISIAGYTDIGNINGGGRAGASQGGLNVSLVDESTVIAKIKNIYIPNAVSSYNSRHPEQPIYLGGNNGIAVDLNGGEKVERDKEVSAASGIIFLSARSTLLWREIYREIFQNVLNQLVLDTKPLYESFRQSMEDYVGVMRQHLNYSARMAKVEHTNHRFIIIGDHALLFAEMQKELQRTKLALHTLHNARFGSDFGVYNYKAHEVSNSVLLFFSVFAAAFIGFIVVIVVELLHRNHVGSK